MKNPWLAAVLNFFGYGLGTVYVGRRVLVGVLLAAGGIPAQVIEILVSPPGPYSNTIPTLWPYLFVGLLLVKVALAIDAFREAKATTSR